MSSPQAPDAHTDRARLTALRVLQKMRKETSWEAAWRDVDLPDGSLDRRFAVELAGGCLRLRQRLDWILAPHVKRGLATLEIDVHDILRLGAYQILEGRVADHAAVHASVELAKRVRPAASGLVNGVLRNLLRQGPRPLPALEDDPLAHLVHGASHPEWMVRRWLERFGPQATAALCDYNNTRPGFRLRVNRLRATVQAISEVLSTVRAGRWSPWSVNAEAAAWSEVMPLLDDGRVSVQDESGVVVTDVCAAGAGTFWIDAAAAPGGKAGALAEATGPEGRVLACDVGARKVQRLRDTAQRLGLTHLDVQQGDARQLSGHQADGVLLDAPCSGLGVLARRPDARWRKSVDDLPRLAALQSELLQAVSRNVRPGGTLVYSVCSFEPEETVAVVDAFTAAHPDFELEETPVEAALQCGTGMVLFLPHEHGMDGGFAARWRRRSD